MSLFAIVKGRITRQERKLARISATEGRVVDLGYSPKRIAVNGLVDFSAGFAKGGASLLRMVDSFYLPGARLVG
jgi:hypothetical protein